MIIEVVKKTKFAEQWIENDEIEQKILSTLRNNDYKFSFDSVKTRLFHYYEEYSIKALQDITVENVKFWQEVCTEAAKHSTNPEEIADRALQAKIKAFGLIKETVKNRFACSIHEVIA